MPEIFTNDDIDFGLYIRETDVKTKLKLVKSYRQALKDSLRAKDRQNKVYLPWLKSKDDFDFRPGEVTVWAGQSGHGKSQMTTHVALSLIGQKQKMVIASFELKPIVNLKRMARMYSGSYPGAPEYQNEAGYKIFDDLYDQFCDFAGPNLYMYDHVGSIETESIIGMARYAAKELKVQHIFIDNLAKCIKKEDDYNMQKAFIDEIMVIAQDYNVHIHVVHHLKKPPKETDMPDKSDVKGSGSIVDQVDNLFMVWRNKPKEDELKDARAAQELARDAGVDNPIMQSIKREKEGDVLLTCRKQRNYDGNGEGEPRYALWFCRDSGQYLESPTDQTQIFNNAWPHKRTEWV